MMWHRRETKRQTENTKLNLNIGRNLPTRPRLTPVLPISPFVAKLSPKGRLSLVPTTVPLALVIIRVESRSW